MLQITGGQFRTRRLQVPEDSSVTRPYSQRAREAVFNMLRGHLNGGVVVDLFAGVGTMALESVSRGAVWALMVEQDRTMHAMQVENVETLGCEEETECLLADALGPLVLDRLPKEIDLLFVDPPYAMMESPERRQRVLNQIAAVAPSMAEDGLVVVRTPLEPSEGDHVIEGFAGPESRRYGRGMWVLLYSPTEVVTT
jgi:16S rRNA (guanine966-N2)-methyltransferase